MAKNEYAAKWKDPRWQKKRLEIMERDGFSCRIYGDASSTLAVHHFGYDDGKDPWDYEQCMLITICQFCHEVEHAERPEYEDLLLHTLRKAGFSAHDVFSIAEGFAFLGEFEDKNILSTAIGWAIKDPAFLSAVVGKYMKNFNYKKK